ncbi:cyclin-dependent kinase inhibitor far1 [Entomortierella beljakovae]|nr:cyclin-dependent kinase inhibitor far1 [Entomortierella beljakovae]
MEFYHHNHQVIFLTGATGFLGKTLLEKILRSLPNVDRPANNKTIQDRLESEIFASCLFESLKSHYTCEKEFQEEVASKVYPIQGDITSQNLGMSDEDIKMIQADTTVVINCAASTIFDLPLRTALNINTYGALEVARFAEKIPHLEGIVQISTSHVNPFMMNQQVYEDLYPYPLGDVESTLQLMEKMSDDELSVYEQSTVLRSFPNTFTATKSMTEHLLENWATSSNTPLAIVRPSMIGASISEPVPGWTDGAGMFNGQIVNCALGAIQDWAGVADRVLDIIPVDMVCKTILMAVAQAKKYTGKVRIFQVCTSLHSPVSLDQVSHQIEQYWQQTRVTNIPRLSDSINFQIHDHKSFGEKVRERFKKEHEKAKRGGQNMIRLRMERTFTNFKLWGFLMSFEWFMDISNAISLDRIAPAELHSGIENGFNWAEYLHTYCIGIHKYVLQDDVDIKNQVIRYDANDKKIFNSNILPPTPRL